METIASKDPRAHTANVRKEFRELIEHLRGDIRKIDEPKAQALFETAAEVISGLDTVLNITKKRAKTPGNSSNSRTRICRDTLRDFSRLLSRDGSK